MASRQSVASIVIGTIVIAGIGISPTRADFATVINAPPASTDGLRNIGSNTQLNLYDGAVLGDYFVAGDFWDPSNHIEVNVYGGSVGDDFHAGTRFDLNSDIVVNVFDGIVGEDFTAHSGSLVNVSGGYIGDYFRLESGASINMSGGRLDSELRVGDGSVANISGGTINSYFSAGTGSVVNVSGGTIGDIHSQSGSRLNIMGGDFRLDGVPIAGIGSVGSTLAFDLPEDGLLSGTLADGTPIAISNQRWDYISAGTLTLQAAAIPPTIPRAFHSPRDPTPRGLRAGQTLTVAEGGGVGNHFTASWGSAVTITGGQVGEGFEATGAVVNISGGSIGGVASAFTGSVTNLSGGSIGSNLFAGSGSVVNISGGSVGILFEAADGSIVNLSGGAVDDIFWAHPGSRLNISGSEFRLNGMPVDGLNQAGNSRAFDIPAGSVLSGTLADGRPFAFSGQDYDLFAPGSLTLKAAQVPSAGPTVIHVPKDQAPQGLRTGQTLVVEEGGTVGDRFNANWGTAVVINGGQVGDDFEAVGALVNISGGTIGWQFDAFYGSLVNITGGSIGSVFTANRGSVVNISGGSFDSQFQAQSGSVVNIAGGTMGDYGYGHEGSVINLSGGSIGDGFVLYGGVLNMSGGSVGDELRTTPNSAVNISGGTMGDRFYGGGHVQIAGSNFRLDGEPISGLDAIGSEQVIVIPAEIVLSGTLLDGTPFVFSRQDGDFTDYIEETQLRLQAWNPPAPAAAAIYVPGSPAPLGIRSGQALVVGAGGVLNDNFNAGWGSTLTVTDGKLGDNSEAVGARVTITGGVVGDSFDAFYGSVVNILGGSVGNYFDAHRGSVVNITGGEVGWGFTAHSGSVVNLSGGLIGPDLRAAAGSEIHLFGSGFQLDGVPISNLIPGQILEITDRNVTLSGFLADGSPFLFRLHTYPHWPNDFDPTALLTVTSVSYGDYNGNGVVDAADYVVWQDSLGGTTNLAADGNGNHRIDAGDYDVWRSHFGRTASSGAGATAIPAVPEPATIWLLLLGSLAMCARRCAVNHGVRQSSKRGIGRGCDVYPGLRAASRATTMPV